MISTSLRMLRRQRMACWKTGAWHAPANVVAVRTESPALQRARTRLSASSWPRWLGAMAWRKP